MELEQLQAIVAGVLDLDPETVTEDKSFADDLEADSLDRMEIIMQIEDALGVEIPDDVLESIVTVGDAMEAIRRAE